MNKIVRVIVHATIVQDQMLEFRLIFEDNYEKHIYMNEHEFRAYRASERDVIENAAREYYEQLGEPVDTLSLIFL